MSPQPRITIALDIGSMPDDEKRECLTYVQAYINQLEGEWVLAHMVNPPPVKWNPIERAQYFAFLSTKWKNEIQAERFIREIEQQVRQKLDVARIQIAR